MRDVWADARTDNLASLAVLRRAGFTEWAREKQPDGRECGHLRIARDTDRVAAAVISVCPALQVPTLRSDWVVLRPWRRDDAPRIVEACSDRVSQHFLADLPRDYGHDDALAFVDACHLAAAAGTMLPWCLADPSCDACLGSLAIMDLGVHRSMLGRSAGGVIGYWMHPDARDRGALTLALRHAVRHAFVDVEDGGLGLDRLALRAASTNRASQAVARRVGFVEVGRDRRGERLGDGAFDDLVRFHLLNEEWVASSRPR